MVTKNKAQVVLLERIHEHAAEAFERAGFAVEQVKEALAEDELVRRWPDATVVGIRSNTTLTDSFFARMPKLLAAGAFCVGTNQLDCEAAARHGVAVFNAPYSNTRSVVELAVGGIIALNRRVGDKNMQLHKGAWDKSAKGCHEVRGRRLGIVGYGNIGSQLSVVAESLGLEVYYYDLVDKLSLGNARKCQTLKELLGVADIVTLHVDGRAANRNLFDAARFAQMRPGALFLNISRGAVVDAKALTSALDSGHLGGAFIDVFETEPATTTDQFVSGLQGLPNVILTPHIGGSTEEAQANIGDFVARKLAEYIQTGATALSVNLPSMQVPPLAAACRLVCLHNNVPGVLARVGTILADDGINVEGQHLATRGSWGYVIVDTNRPLSRSALTKIKALPETIRLRLIGTGRKEPA